jgi:tetratricopeptide (TPR) repeat protein
VKRLIVALAVVAGACAPKTVPLANENATRFREFVEPFIPDAFGGYPAAVASQTRGWRFLQYGSLRDAEREFNLALKSAPEFYPADTSFGYLELARKDPKAALAHFEKALLQNGRYVPALVGGGQAFLALGRDKDALFAFQSAVAVEPGLGDIRRRIDALQFRGVEQQLASARQAVKDGRFDAAAAAYESAIAASPDSAFLYRELADVEVKRGAPDAALTDLQKAVALDASDTVAMVRSATCSPAAMTARPLGGEAAVIEPSEAVEAKLDVARARAEARVCRRNIGRSRTRRPSGSFRADRHQAPRARPGGAEEGRRGRQRRPLALGRHVDRRGGPRRHHRAVRKPPVPAERRRAAIGSRGRHEPAARARRGRGAEPRAFVANRAHPLQRSRGFAPGVSGRLDGRRRGRHGDGTG